MSELETARAGVFLSILALTLTWLLFSNADDARTGARAVQPVAVCASTHGAICDAAPVESSVAVAADVAYLSEIEVTAARLPAPLGHLLVVATRLPSDSLSKVQLAEAASKDKSVVVR
jgi:hypothetical protein